MDISCISTLSLFDLVHGEASLILGLVLYICSYGTHDEKAIGISLEGQMI